MSTVENKVKFGLKNFHYGNFTETEVNGEVTITYDVPKAITGAVNLTLDPNGEAMEFYADDGLYASETPNNGYTGSIEFANLPEQFKIDCLGYKKDANGVLIENKEAKIKPIAALFEENGDKTQTRFCFYNVMPSRPSQSNKTTEKSNTPATSIMNVTVLPSRESGDIKAFAKKGDAPYENWFKTVYTKQDTATPAKVILTEGE